MELYRSFLFIVVLPWVAVVAFRDAFPPVVQRCNYGVLFISKGQATPNAGFWPHTFHCVLPSLPPWQPIDNWCSNPLYESVCAEFNYLVHLGISFSYHTQLQFRHTLQAAYDLLPNTPLPPNFAKRKRSLLPFIGKISSSLLGTATEDDIKTLAAHVQAISQSQSKLLSGFQAQAEHLSSFMTLSQAQVTQPGI